jgi:outer membrane lipoprotein-sorting protein
MRSGMIYVNSPTQYGGGSMKWSILAISLIIPAVSPAYAGNPPTAADIMQKVEDKSFGKDASAIHQIEIIPKAGQKRFRKYQILRKEYPDTIKLVTFLSAPTDVAGAAFMVWDNKKSDDQRWIYLPAIGQVRRLVVGDSRQSFFGSDFVFEDFTNRDPDLDTHKLIGAQKVDNWDCYVIESTPKNTSGLGFAKRKVWVWKDDPMQIREELYNAQGKVIRRIQAKEIKEIEHIQTFIQVVADDLQTGSQSRIEASDIHYNTNIPDERFQEAQLPRGAPANNQTAPVQPVKKP